MNRSKIKKIAISFLTQAGSRCCGIFFGNIHFYNDSKICGFKKRAKIKEKVKGLKGKLKAKLKDSNGRRGACGKYGHGSCGSVDRGSLGGVGSDCQQGCRRPTVQVAATGVAGS